MGEDGASGMRQKRAGHLAGTPVSCLRACCGREEVAQRDDMTGIPLWNNILVTIQNWKTAVWITNVYRPIVGSY